MGTRGFSLLQGVHDGVVVALCIDDRLHNLIMRRWFPLPLVDDARQGEDGGDHQGGYQARHELRPVGVFPHVRRRERSDPDGDWMSVVRGVVLPYTQVRPLVLHPDRLENDASIIVDGDVFTLVENGHDMTLTMEQEVRQVTISRAGQLEGGVLFRYVG